MHQPKPHEPYLAEHRAAVQDFARVASALDAAAWVKPVSPEKWSPALITEHVTLSIVAFSDDAAGRAPMAMRLTRFRRFLLRHTVLRRILRSGDFPRRVPAPRETLPPHTPRLQRDALEDLDAASRSLDATLRAHPAPERCRITHPYFGRLPLITALRLLTLHARHHLAQLPRRPTGP